MTTSTTAHGFRLGVISCVVGARNGQGRLTCNHAMGRLVDRFRAELPSTRLCLPVRPDWQPSMNHVLDFPAVDVTELPPLRSVIRSQAYYFQTRRIVRQFAKSVDVLFIRVPFQLPTALLDLPAPKVLHVVGNPLEVVAASSNYHGIMRALALRVAARDCKTLRRLTAEPMTRVVTNGREMWDQLDCRNGRVVVSSCIHEREMQPRENGDLADPPRILFVGFLRPEKGIHDLLDAFELLRKTRPLKLTLAGGADTSSESTFRERINNNRYRDDITLTGLVDFGEPLFDLYRSHDVYVQPSLSEGTPRTLVEARAFGCPVVATNVGGIPTSVENEVNGLLVEPRDAQGLARAIDRVLSDGKLRARLSKEGFRYAQTRTLESFVDELIEEIKILVEARTKSAMPSKQM